MATAEERLERERQHARVVLETDESNWGWHTPAGRIRWQRRLDFLRAALPDKHAAVLEVGAGTGTFTHALNESFTKLTAIDISADLLEAARARAPGARLVCMDAHDLQFDSDSFDAVIGCSVLHHLDWRRALMEFLRVLKRGGVIRFSEPNLLNPQIFLQKNIPALKRMVGDSPDEYAFTARCIRRDLARAGFTNIDVRPFEFLHPMVPEQLISVVCKLEAALMKTPMRHIGGSLQISASKPV